MYEGVRNMSELLDAWGLPTGEPPAAPGPGPDPVIDGYLFDASRRLALQLTDADGHAPVEEVGAYAADPLADIEAEELARGLRVVAETEGVRELTGEQREAFLEAAVEQALDEWRTSSTFSDDPEVRHQLIEERLREAVARLATR